MRKRRWLDWDGFGNARDLGGLPTVHGGHTVSRRLIRSDAPRSLNADGWATLEAYGVRTVIDLRNDDELGPDSAPPPASIASVRVPLDDIDDTEMWEFFEAEGYGGLSPLYYPEFMRRKPERCAAAVAAIADAAPGGVLVHCAAGRDRTGLVALLVLALAGVPADDIVADHALTDERVCTVADLHGRSFTPADFDHLYAERSTTPRRIITGIVNGSTLDADPADYLRQGGVTDAQLDAVRTRLLG